MMGEQRTALTEKDIEDLYREVSGEYNDTPLATRDGWTHAPSEFGLLEMRAIARYLPPNGTLLDIGTGCGIGPRFARKLGAKVISVDSLSTAGRAAIENVALAGVEGHFVDVLNEPLPSVDASIDCVLFADVIEHLPHSPKPVLDEIHRVLKPGGVCIATTPNATRLSVRLKVLLGYSNWPNLREYFDASFHGGHHHEYTIEDFRYAFEATGFAIEDLTMFEENLRNAKLERLNDARTHTRRQDPLKREPLRFRLAKAPLVFLTDLIPGLRSNMLLIART